MQLVAKLYLERSALYCSMLHSWEHEVSKTP